MRALVMETLRRQGKASALTLRDKAKDMTGTELIAEEDFVPDFDPKKDYTSWPINSPVRDEGQVWLLLIPHNAAHYTGRPADLRALWGLAHTTDPEKAKAWVAPYGTSGLYQRGECCKVDGVVYRSTEDNNPYSPTDYPAWWSKVEE